MRGVTRVCARSPAWEVPMKWITSEPFGMLRPYRQDGKPDFPEIICPKDNIVTWRRGRSTSTRTGLIDFPAMRSTFGRVDFARPCWYQLSRNNITFFAVQIDVQTLALDFRSDPQSDCSSH